MCLCSWGGEQQGEAGVTGDRTGQEEVPIANGSIEYCEVSLPPRHLDAILSHDYEIPSS